MRILDTRDHDLDRLRRVLRAHCLGLYGSQLGAAFIIGSYASGRHRDTSDLDLLIVIDESTDSRPHRARAFGEPPDYDGPELSPVIYTRAEFFSFPSFVLTLLDAHDTLYSRSGDSRYEASMLVRAVQEYAESNGIVRVPHKGGYYWRGLPT
jgi:hypothetical protein